MTCLLHLPLLPASQLAEAVFYDEATVNGGSLSQRLESFQSGSCSVKYLTITFFVINDDILF